MLVGTVGGGLLGQLDLAWPYVIRSVLLALVFLVAYRDDDDIGFTPRRVTAAELPGEIARNARAGVAFGWAQEPLRMLMLAALLQTGFLIWAFYASQPYLLELLDSDAIWVAGPSPQGSRSRRSPAISWSSSSGHGAVGEPDHSCSPLSIRRSTGAAIALGRCRRSWPALVALLLITAGPCIGQPAPGRA